MQSVVAVSLVLLVVFATVQAGAMMLSVNRLTADLARACRQMDTAGLVLAADRERFVADEVLGAATQLKPDLLTVSNVRSEALAAMQGARLAAGAPSGGAGEEGAGSDAGVVQRTDAVSVSFDVRYELPSLTAVPGLAHRTIARHVECEQLAGRIVEVEVGA
ncbi:MAG: hypothetical protein V8S24_09650 [Gordonibacter pamelaeae]